MFCDFWEAYEGLDDRAAEALRLCLEGDVRQWGVRYPVLQHLAVQVTIDPTAFLPEMYTEPYQILAILDPRNRGLQAVIAVWLPRHLPSRHELRRMVKGQWEYARGPVGQHSHALYHELGHVLDLEGRLATDPHYQPSEADRSHLEAGAEDARRSQFPRDVSHATDNAIRAAWSSYRQWR